MIVVGVDIGIKHLALAEVVLEEEAWAPAADAAVRPACAIASLGALRLVDITRYTHERVSRAECTLDHSNHLGDRLTHFWQEHGELLARADLVALEQQPITGLTSVECFLFNECRATVELVSPNQLHAWVFGPRHGLGYEQRKTRMEMHAAALVAELTADPTRWDRETRDLPRRHDVADALLVAWYAALRRRALLSDAPVPPARRVARVSPHFGGGWPAGAKGRRWRAKMLGE